MGSGVRAGVAGRDDKLTAIYRVRVDLDGATPPIWRRLDLRADLPLDVVHLVVQAAFEWENRHLYRFATGGGPFDDGSQRYLCDEDIAEGEDQGAPASQTPLNAALHRPGDRLAYVYDYGDFWELTFTLEQVTTALDDSPAAAVIDGQRAAPPEDSRGFVDTPSPDTVFEVDEINDALRSPLFVALTVGVDSRLVALLSRLPNGLGSISVARLGSAPTTVGDADLRANLAPVRWFLNRAADGGIPLTSAGYLKPADVTAASETVPEMADWIGKNNREVNCLPLLAFRQSLQTMGLLRKYKGSLVLTKAGAAAQRDPVVLLQHLASRLVPSDPHTFECHATLLFLAQAGGSEDSWVRIGEIAEALTDLGWRTADGRGVETYEIARLAVGGVLRNICNRPRKFAEHNWVSPAAAALARAALRPKRPRR